MTDQQKEAEEALPHMRALRLIELGENEASLGNMFEAGKRFLEAVHLRDAILGEDDKLMAKRQLVRVSSSCGFWFWDHRSELQTEKDPPGGPEGLALGLALQLLPEALRLAMSASQDQALKIQDECRKRELECTDPAVLEASITAHINLYIYAKRRS